MEWAVNIIKFQRAKELSNSKDEEDIKRIYISIGGLINKNYVEKNNVIPDIVVAKKSATKKRTKSKAS